MDKNEGALYENRVRENAIVFTKEGGDWVMRITQDCISVNNNVSTDDAAEAVIAAIGRYLNKSKWVGLTDEEVLLIYRDQSNQDFQMRLDPFKLYAAFEAKLRSRNGG